MFFVVVQGSHHVECGKHHDICDQTQAARAMLLYCTIDQRKMSQGGSEEGLRYARVGNCTVQMIQLLARKLCTVYNSLVTPMLH